MTRMQTNGFDEIDAAVLDLFADDEPGRTEATSASDVRSKGWLRRAGPSVLERTPALEPVASATPIAQRGSRVSNR